MRSTAAHEHLQVMPATPDPEAVLAGLNPEQRQAAEAVAGPVAILAGAGTGKTRVISHRVAYAVATGAVDEREVLVVSFTTKAAGEMTHRLRALGMTRATASTLHAAALRQLRYFWPSRYGAELPEPLPSKLGIIGPLARNLPGGYRFTSAKDLADEVEWAKNRRIPPADYEATALARKPPVPAELMARLYAEYEATKQRAGRLDYEDFLEQAIRLYETDAAAADLVRRRFTWFSVDEYQDTNPLQQALLDQWLGDRRDIGVVGDPNQTIYSFTGATPRFLLDFATRYPEARTISLVRNYRSTPQILALANRLVGDGAGPQLQSTTQDGPVPEVASHASEAAELAWIVRRHGELRGLGVQDTEMAVLTRTNAQLDPIARALREAGIPFRFRGIPFFRLPDVAAAIRALGTVRRGSDLEAAALARWRELGFQPDAAPDDPEAAQRQANFGTLLTILRRFVATHADATAGDLAAEFERLAAAEADENAQGVTLSTIHGAKGAEWEAVFVPSLEEGSLPIQYALKSPEAIGEERRLLYVALTRAKRHLSLSWSTERTTPRGAVARQRPSRFVVELQPKAAQRPRAGARAPRPSEALSGSEQQRFERLAEWRRDRARRDGVPAYVIAHDAHLRSIAAANPGSADDLLAVAGMGPTRVDRYGDEILAACRGA